MSILDPKPLTPGTAAEQAADPETPFGAALSATILDNIQTSATDPAGAVAPRGKTVYAESFRDGVRTDQQIIGAAVAALASGGRLKLEPGRTYTFTTGQVFDLTSKPNVLIDGQGATIDGSTVASGTIVQFKGGSGSISTGLTAALTTRSATLTVTSSAGFAVGDMILIASSGEIFNPDRSVHIKQEMARVKSVPDGTTLVLDGRTWNTYSLTGFTVSVQKIPAMKNIQVEGITVKGAGGGSNQSGLSCIYFDGLRLTNVNVIGAGVEGISAGTGMDLTAAGCRATGANATGVGYGFHVTRVQSVKFAYCYGKDNRHSFDVDDVRDGVYEACTAEFDSSAGISTHGATDTIRILNSTVKDCGGGIVARGKNTLIQGNHITGSKTATESSQSYIHGITLGDDTPHPWGIGLAGTGLSIIGNRIDISGPDYSATTSYGIYCTASLLDAEIRDNYISGFSAHGIYAKGDTGLRVRIANNKLNCTAQVGTFGTTQLNAIILSPSHAVAGNTLKEVTVEGNTITGALWDGIRIKGGFDNTAVSDNLVIKGNTVGACGNSRVNLSDGYFGARMEVWGNEWLGQDTAATVVSVGAAGNYVAMPYVGANGWGSKGVRPLAQGQELGARMRPGIYYGPQGGSAATAPTSGWLLAVPIFVPRSTTIDRIGVNVTTAGAAGSVVKVGIYADVLDSYGGYPGNLVSGSEQTLVAETTGFKEATVSLPLTPGLYWLAAVVQGGSPSVTVLSGSGNQVVGYQAAGTVAGRLAWLQTGVTGALPATFSTSASSQGTAPLVQVRAS